MITDPINYKDQTTLALDANANSVTTALDIKNNTHVAWSVEEKTGSHSTHVLTFQRSTDNVNWDSSSSTLTAGTTYQIKNLQARARYIRIKVTTVEGSASTVDIVVNAK